MSWDNVLDVKNIKIWTDYSDSTQGHLFVNDNHQLKLNVGISFTLDTGETEGPTEDEVHSALSLINNQDSGPLKYLSIVEAGRYTSVYDPNHVSIDPQNDIDDGIYDFVLTYYVSSPSNLNAETHSESVALRVEYPQTNTDGTTTVVVKETSAKGNYYTKTYVSILCYPPKLYGAQGQNRTNILCSNIQVDSNGKNSDDNYTHTDSAFYVISLYVDDPYFRLFYSDGAQDPDPDRDVEPFTVDVSADDGHWNYVYDSYFPNIKGGEMNYTVRAVIRFNAEQNDHVYIAHVDVQQKENQITLVHIHTYAEHIADEDLEDMIKYIYIRVYDQFGNSASVVAYHSSDMNFIKSVS